MSDGRAIRLGLGPNLAQFSLLVVVNAFVGAMIGLERTILPAIAEHEFHLAARAAVLSFIVVFGIAKALTGFAAGAVLLGAGTAMVYPTLLAAIADVAHPSWRASAVGVYRLWRDLGYAIGALLAGITADAFGIAAAIWLVAAVTFASGLVVAVRMRETLRPTSASPHPAEPGGG